MLTMSVSPFGHSCPNDKLPVCCSSICGGGGCRLRAPRWQLLQVGAHLLVLAPVPGLVLLAAVVGHLRQESASV